MSQPRYKIFRVRVDHVECYVRADNEETVARLLKEYGVNDFVVERAPGKSRVATSVIACIRDKLRKAK